MFGPVEVLKLFEFDLEAKLRRYRGLACLPLSWERPCLRRHSAGGGWLSETISQVGDRVEGGGWRVEIGRSDTWRPTTIQCLLSPRVLVVSPVQCILSPSCPIQLLAWPQIPCHLCNESSKEDTKDAYWSVPSVFFLPKRSPEPTEHSMRQFCFLKAISGACITKVL